jgi:hypothetical protein
MYVTDQTNRYFGDYHRVCLNVVVDCPLGNGDDVPESVKLKKKLVQMAVPTEYVAQVQQKLLDNFIAHAKSYLLTDGFAQQLWQTQQETERRAFRHFI